MKKKTSRHLKILSWKTTKSRFLDEKNILSKEIKVIFRIDFTSVEDVQRLYINV